MRQIEKKDIRYKSADGQNEVAAVLYEPQGTVFCVLQIAHGLCEYIARYDDFSRFLAQNGVAVCGNDHLGHGDTAQSADDYGYFGPHGARAFVLRDIKYLAEECQTRYPGVPYVLLGHSMGSFFARKFACVWPEMLDGLILSGTSGHSPLLRMGLSMARVLEKSHGERYRSPFLQKLTFGSYLARIPNANTRYDWISGEEEVVRQYVRDEKCNFLFTVGGYYELFHILHEVSGKSWAMAMPKDLPIFLFSGAEDPVGDFGHGVRQVEAWLKKAGVGPLSLTLYPGGRHEMLNEKDRKQVYSDILEFLKANSKNDLATNLVK